MDAAARPNQIDIERFPGEVAAPPGNRSWRDRFTGFANSTVGRFLLVLLAVFVAKQALTVLVFPPFSGHDEVAHFNYVQTVATEHRVPTLFRCPTDDGQGCLNSSGGLTNTEFATWQGDVLPDYFYRYCEYILDWKPCESRWIDQPFRAANWGAVGQFPAGTQYAANHPPLYYLLVAPFAKAADSLSPEALQYLLRVLAIPFGLMIVLLAFLTVRELFSGDRFLLMTVPAFVAFQPQVSYESAMVNNDIAGIAFVSLVIYLLARGIRRGFDLVTCAWIGGALGLAMLTKSNSLIIIPAIAAAISTEVLASSAVTMLSVWTCLVELRHTASTSSSERRAGGASCADTATQWKAISGRASATRAMSPALSITWLSRRSASNQCFSSPRSSTSERLTAGLPAARAWAPRPLRAP